MNLKVLPSADVLTQAAQGNLDGVFSAPNAGMINVVKTGYDLKWTLGNYSANKDSKTGLWTKAKNGKPQPLAKLVGARVVSVAGPGSVIDYPIYEALKKAKVDSTKVQLQLLSATDIPTALENGGFDAGWVIDPLWAPLVDNPNLALAIGQPIGEPLGGMIMGPSLLKNRPVALAFTRAYIRTINTYFAGDYKSNSKFVAELADVLGVPTSQLSATPSIDFDWEIRDRSIGGMEDAYLAEGAMTGSPLAATKLVDRSLYAEAVGHAK